MTKVKKYHKSQRKHHKIRKIPQKSKNNIKVGKKQYKIRKTSQKSEKPQKWKKAPHN